MGEDPLLRYHRYTRERGVNWPLYLLARILLTPAILVWFRLARGGREHARVEGPLIVASNHRSFLDPFAIGVTLPWSKPMCYVAKREIFEHRFLGWLLSRVGAFPIRRGESDEDAMTTARMVLERGGTVCIFPEGTRIRSGSLSTPKRGVGRLALETGAPVLPVAVHGTERVRRGWRIRPRKVRIRIGRPLTFPRAERPSPALAAAVTGRIWPNIELQWEALGGLPPMRRAAVIGAGSWGTAVAVLLSRGGLEVQLGCRSAEQVHELEEARAERREAAGVRLPESVRVKRAAEIELAGLDLICLAVPAAALPQAVGSIADRVGERAAILQAGRGLVAPHGELPSAYIGARVRARAIACLGGPVEAQEAASGAAALVLASADPDLRAQLGEVLDRAGLACERSGDIVGIELSSTATEAAALAAAVALPYGRNAAGIAAAEVWRECVAYAGGRGARAETLVGLAGVGDLAATLTRPSAASRRAAGLLAGGAGLEQVRSELGDAAEGLDAVALLASAIDEAGQEAEGLRGLAGLLEGRIGSDEWVAGLRRAERSRRAA